MGEMDDRLGVCSWSLQPDSAADLVERLGAVGVGRVQLHLDPLRDDWAEGSGGPWGKAATTALAEAGITIASGMMTMAGEDYTTLESIKATGGVVPDGTWDENLAAAKKNAVIADRLGLGLVTFHGGFIPHDEADPARRVIIDRLATLRDVFDARGVAIALETGQQTGETLLGVLDDLPGVGVNFDPANMILYGMGDPIAALERLGPRVAQLHIKDAAPASAAGAWGVEVPVGEGAVDWARFFAVAARVCPGVGMMLEREAGDTRIEDLRRGASVVRERAAGERA